MLLEGCKLLKQFSLNFCCCCLNTFFMISFNIPKPILIFCIRQRKAKHVQGRVAELVEKEKSWNPGKFENSYDSSTEVNLGLATDETSC